MVVKLNDVVYTTVVEVQGGRQGHARSSGGKPLDLTLQRPAQVGTSASGTNPEQLFAAGYAACLQSALIGAASCAGHNASRLDIIANVNIGKTENETYELGAVFDIKISGVDQETAESLIAEAHNGCPYSNVVRGNIEVDLNVRALRLV
jgi:Ohr subfamily peroxiredoxin